MKLVWAAAAEADLDEIVRDVADNDINAAFAIEDRIRECVERLSDYPESGRQGFVSGTRELVVTGTRYLVVYQVAQDAVELLQVVHGRRDVTARARFRQ